jgi:presenilin-like A22 family membrane protease
MSNIFIQVLFHIHIHIHILSRFLLFFSIIKLLVGAIIDTSWPQNIATPCILKHGNNMFLSLHQYPKTCL